MNAHRTALTVMTLCLILFAQASFAEDGAVLKDFTLHEAGGDGVFRFSEARGSYVTLHFLLQTDCSNCMRLTREYVTRADEMPGVVHVFIKPDSAEDIDGWKIKLRDIFDEDEIAKDAGLPVIYRDTGAALARALDIPDGYQFHGEVVHYPATILVDPEGREVFRYVGEHTRDRLLFDQFIVKMKGLKLRRGED